MSVWEDSPSQLLKNTLSSFQMSLRPCGTTGEKVNHKAKKQVSSLTFCTILDITNKNKFAESLSKKGERRGVIADLDLTGFIKMTA